MKLEVGMYVRTKIGIKKIYRIDDNKSKYKYLYKLKKQDEDGCIDLGVLSNKDIIGSPKFNIIDLIGVEDIVTVFSDLHDLCGNETFNIKDDNHLKHLKNGIENGYFHLINVVTKEQFESVSYKV